MNSRSLTTVLKIALAGGIVAAVLAPFAFGAAPLAYATPTAIAAKITGGIPRMQTGNAGAPTVITATKCTGLGAAHAGKFNTFRCKATYDNGQETGIVWVRARPGGQFCAATTGLSACPVAAATIGDPRVCSLAPAPPTADPNACALGSAILAMNRAMAVKFAPPGATPTPISLLNISCTGQNLKWNCVFSTSLDRTVHNAAIVFTQATDGTWTANVNGCTVLPGAPSGGYRWRVGATPACN